MADQFLVRAYNVGLGDCIYCRIPDARVVDGETDDFHILIDCGTWSGIELLRDALRHLESVLPRAEDGRARLDLLVVTHEHKDHITGFDPEYFENFKFESIWMNAAMNPDHPQADRTRRLHAFAATAMRAIERSNLALSPEVRNLVELFSLGNEGAMRALRETLPEASGIEPTYVHAGMTSRDFDLPLADDTVIRVLGPEQDIDRFYLGQEADETLRGFTDSLSSFRSADASEGPLPTNISSSDFRLLQSRMLSGTLAFAELSSRVTNNTSVVLLIEWRGKRLLFVGDAEWDTKFKERKSNGAWNVMWHERRRALNAPIDFLKIGHHGSENSTPWNDREDGRSTEPGAILDAILPVPSGRRKPRAQAIVSTVRQRYETIPRSALLVEIGRRVANTRNYQQEFEEGNIESSELARFREYEKPWFAEPQPWRTDCEFLLKGEGFVDVVIESGQ